MGLSLQSAADPGVVGFDAGWKLELRTEDAKTKEPVDDGMMTLSRQHYFGQIKIEASSSFEAPTFEAVIEGLSDKDHNRIVTGQFVFVKVFLGWRDLGSGGVAPFKNIGALFSGSEGDPGNYHEVLHGRLRTCERLHGSFRYRTRLAGVDYRFHRLQCNKPTELDVRPGAPASRYAELLCKEFDIPVVIHPRGKKGQAIDEVITIDECLTVADALQKVAKKAHGDGQGRQIPMFLRTDGLHFGWWTAPVVSVGQQGEPKPLEPRTGFVECKPLIDPNPDECGRDPFGAPTILRFDVTLRGRADIAVGDKVEIAVDLPSPGTPSVHGSSSGPLGDVVGGIVDSFGAQHDSKPEPFGVVSVKHEINRTHGFVTTLRIEDQEKNRSATKQTESENIAQGRALSEESRIAHALSARARAEQDAARGLGISEVNAQWVAAGEDSGHSVAAQRLDLQEGLENDGAANVTVRMNRVDTPIQLFNKPYLTPYAFGNTGLVIPHYPGTRVVDLHYHKDVSQTMVAGCIWPEGDAPESKYGDWWLSLPTRVETVESIADSRNAATPTGPASHDLIAIDGGRVIQVRGLRISVGEGKMAHAGVRPDNASLDELLIEHKSGARFHIDPDGNITISTPGDIAFEANKITMNVADSVEVS